MGLLLNTARAHIFHPVDIAHSPVYNCAMVTIGIRRLAKGNKINMHDGHVQGLEARIQRLRGYDTAKSASESNSRDQAPGLHGTQAEAVRRHKG